MTDEEIVKAIAEKVMGWHLVEGGLTWSEIPHCTQHDKFWVYVGDWNPLTSEANCAAVLEKMAETRTVSIGRSALSHHEEWEAEFWLIDDMSKSINTWDKDRKRAICLAALKAVSP